MAHRQRNPNFHVSSAKPPKLRKFSGEENAEDFIHEALTLLTLQNLPQKQAAMWILDALEGAARTLVLSHDTSDIDTPHKILEFLRSEWGERKTQTALRKAFYRRTQGVMESVSEFGMVMQTLWKKCNHNVPQIEQLSEDSLTLTFIDGLRTAALRRELKKTVQGAPQPLSFNELIQLAREWMREEGEEDTNTQVAEHRVDLHEEGSQVCVDKVDSKKNQGARIVPYHPELEAMKRQLQEACDKIKFLEAERKEQQIPTGKIMSENRGNYQQLSEVRCWQCSQLGHIKSRCPENRERYRGSQQYPPRGFRFGQREVVPTCWKCGKNDHFMAQCPDQDRDRSSPGNWTRDRNFRSHRERVSEN